MRTVCCLIVIPRSRSRSMESSTWSTAFLGSMAPVRASSRSARVDLPWSMWATMEKFRIRESATKFRISRDDFVFPDYGAGGDPRASSDHGPGAHHACPEDGGPPPRVAPPGPAGREAVGGDPAFQEAGEEVALHGDGAARRDQVEQLALEEVDARVDGVGADLLARRLLQEGPDPAVGLRLHQPEGRRVLPGRGGGAGPGPAGPG